MKIEFAKPKLLEKEENKGLKSRGAVPLSGAVIHVLIPHLCRVLCLVFKKKSILTFTIYPGCLSGCLTKPQFFVGRFFKQPNCWRNRHPSGKKKDNDAEKKVKYESLHFTHEPKFLSFCNIFVLICGVVTFVVVYFDSDPQQILQSSYGSGSFFFFFCIKTLVFSC